VLCLLFLSAPSSAPGVRATAGGRADRGEASQPPPPAAASPLFPLAAGWSVTLPSPPSAEPCYDETQGYVPLRNGQVLAFSLATGETRWTAEVTSNLRPAAGDGLVFLAAGDTIQALSAVDGTSRWRFPSGSRLSAALCWNAGWLVAGTEQGEVIALRARDGQKLWQQTVGAAPHTEPTVAGPTLLLPLGGGRIVALKLETGDTLWEHKVGGVPSEVLALEDRLFVGSTDNLLYCLATGKGRLLWHWRAGGDIVGMPVLDRSRVYFVALDNVLRALDRNRGSLSWTRALSNRPGFGPVQVGGLLLVSGRSPAIHAFWMRDGTPAGDFTAPGDLVGPPHLIQGVTELDDTLMILTGDGQLQALRAAVTQPADAAAYPRSASFTTLARRATPNSIRATGGREKDKRIRCAPLPSTKNALPTT
jgi:outer membrane protein assembly factor BamB